MQDADNSMTNMEIEYVEEIIDFILWDTPTSMIPTSERVWQIAGELLARQDAASSIVQAAVVECWKFLDCDNIICH
ncbi:MAG: hypothetical protein ACRYF2_04710 [Janthinobacterium lividum]